MAPHCEKVNLLLLLHQRRAQFAQPHHANALHYLSATTTTAAYYYNDDDDNNNSSVTLY